MDNRIFVILPVRNRKEISLSFVTSLINQTYSNFHLVLIDDGSTDGTIEAIKHILPEFTIIKGEGNLWWAGALDKGYRWVKNTIGKNSGFVLIINDDVLIEKDFISNGLKILRKSAKRSLVIAQSCIIKGNKVIPIDKGIHIDWKRLRFDKVERIEDINCSSTRGLFLEAQDFLKIGGFYPRLLPHYFSDYQFTHRAFKKGYRIISHSDVQVITNESTTGYHKLKAKSFSHFRKLLFSKKYVNNPIYFSSFIILSSPFIFVLPNLLRVWFSSIKETLSFFKK